MSGLESFHCKLLDGQAIDNFYFCPICQDIMYRPVSLCCGHTCCKTCIENLFANSRPPVKCPSCRTEIANKQVNVNVALNILVNKVHIKCTNEGCHWEGENGQKEDHYNSCSFLKMECADNCGFSGVRATMEEHATCCPYKKEPCDFCKEGVRRKDKHDHAQQCDEKPRGCPFDCGALLPRSHFYLHLLNCKNRLVRCKVRGCYKTMFQNDQKEHENEYRATHEKLLEEVQKLKYHMFDEQRELRKVEKKEETVASFQWSVEKFKDTAALTCQSGTLLSPLMTFKDYKFRCVLRKSPSSRSLFFLSLRAEPGTSPLFIKSSFVFKTSEASEFARQVHPLVRLEENDSCCEQELVLLDIANEDRLSITLFIQSYYLL